MQFRSLLGLFLGACWMVACGESGSGGSGGTGGTGGEGGKTGCGSPADCATPPESCKAATCTSGVCGVGNAVDGPSTKQTAGDCKQDVCQAGALVTQNDDSDVSDAQGDCTQDLCSGGTKATTPEEMGTPCTVDNGTVCNAMGKCVECNTSADCKEANTPVCDSATSVCVGLNCMDQLKNGDETDVDCGGSCSPCPESKTCLVGGDCQSGVCESGVCQPPTCADSVKNGNETGKDCGGPDCEQCGPDEGCNSNEDCIGSECSGVGGTCVPNCLDKTKNNAETDVDCGGGTCGPCAVGQQCDGQDTNCAAGAYCDANTCAAKKINGVDCATDTQCTSGFCTDGVCCVAKCNGVCRACNLPDKEGFCENHPNGTDPDNECNGNGGTDVCEGGGVCAKALGTPCTMGSECANNVCIDGVCCLTTCDLKCEACSAALTGGVDGTCAKITANTDPDAECPGVLTCNGAGTCSATLVNGTPCTLSLECQSNFCADGVCCTSACNGLCRACDLPGTVGSCMLVPPGADPSNECPGASTCSGNGTCQ